MYNRYVPQPDGSYRRNRIQESPSPPQKQESKPPQPCPAPPPPSPPVRPEPRSQPRPAPPRQKKSNEQTGIGQFLRQLLPRDFDTEDLLIVLLLLLMTGDCQEDQNTALMTLVLYLFL